MKTDIFAWENNKKEILFFLFCMVSEGYFLKIYTLLLGFQNSRIKIETFLREKCTLPPILDMVPNFLVFLVTPPLREEFNKINGILPLRYGPHLLTPLYERKTNIYMPTIKFRLIRVIWQLPADPFRKLWSFSVPSDRDPSWGGSPTKI